MIILENKGGMYPVVTHRLAWFQGFIAHVIFLSVYLWTMLCYDF